MRDSKKSLKINKNKIEDIKPEHYLTHSMPLSSFQNICEVSEKGAYKYLHGDVLREIDFDTDSIEENKDIKDGWIVVAYKGLALGWGKCKGKVIKNHYPKGLRNMN